MTGNALTIVTPDGVPVLKLDGEPIADDSQVSMPAGDLARFVFAYIEAAATAGVAAGIARGISADPQVVAAATLAEGLRYLADRRADPADVAAATTAVHIASMPARRSTRTVTRRNDNGSIAETVDVEQDVA